MTHKKYDRAYFDKWYHDPSQRVITPQAVARKVRLAVGIAESLLERPVKTVLDIGCGEGVWRGHLKKMRPDVRYTGVESSDYAIERFGASRGIRKGSFGTVGQTGLRGAFDLIVVCDVLHYVPDSELRPGLAAIASYLGGVAYLEAYTTDDSIVGDTASWHHRTPGKYRKLFAEAGLTGVGMHCYVGRSLIEQTVALERTR